MTLGESIAYYMALLMVVVLPPLPLLWLIIHGFVDGWRRIGTVATYVVVILLYGLAAGGIYWIREPLLSVKFVLHPVAALAGAASLAYAVYLRYRIEQVFGRARLMGVPEISGGDQSVLITSGIYARVRHPRYVEGVFITLGIALLCNYLVLYVLLPLYVIEIYLVVLLEERELRRRFGSAYDEYARSVPRFIPARERR